MEVLDLRSVQQSFDFHFVLCDSLTNLQVPFDCILLSLSIHAKCTQGGFAESILHHLRVLPFPRSTSILDLLELLDSLLGLEPQLDFEFADLVFGFT